MKSLQERLRTDPRMKIGGLKPVCPGSKPTTKPHPLPKRSNDMYKNYKEPLPARTLPAMEITRVDTQDGEEKFRLEVGGSYVGEYDTFGDACANYEAYMANHYYDDIYG